MELIEAIKSGNLARIDEIITGNPVILDSLNEAVTAHCENCFDSVDEFAELAAWLHVANKYDPQNWNLMTSDVAERIIIRMLKLDFERAKPVIHELMTNHNLSKEIFPVSLSGILIESFLAKSAITDDDRAWVDELSNDVINADHTKFANQLSREFVLSSLFFVTFFSAPNTPNSAAELMQGLSRLDGIVEPATRKYFLRNLESIIRDNVLPIIETREHTMKSYARMVLHVDHIPAITPPKNDLKSHCHKLAALLRHTDAEILLETLTPSDKLLISSACKGERHRGAA